MKKLPLTIVASSLALSFSAFAQENQLPTEAFLGAPSDGRVVMDTYGNCVRTSQWNTDRNIVGCGKAKPAPVAVISPPSPQPAPAAAAPAPAAAPAAAASTSSAAPAAAALAAVPAAAAAAPQTKPMRTVTVSGDAFFDTNKATFRKEAQPELEKISARVRNVSSVEAIQITGFTDNTGTADYNQKLSEARAKAVRDWLVDWGIDQLRLQTSGFGGEKPLVPPTSKGAQAINDRIELIVLERK